VIRSRALAPGIVDVRLLGSPGTPIGAVRGPHCDAQVLVWQDMAGLTPGRLPRYVKRYADLDRILEEAAGAFAEEVRRGDFPTDEHSYH
jgi:3-methyl-2-oxobutanoate hydroxymethyltransferase